MQGIPRKVQNPKESALERDLQRSSGNIVVFRDGPCAEELLFIYPSESQISAE